VFDASSVVEREITVSLLGGREDAERGRERERERDISRHAAR
jgi:hypothetical protein